MRGFWHIAWRAVFGKMHAQISVSSNLTWIAPSNALGCYCHTNLDASIPRTCKEASKFPCTTVPTYFHASTKFICGNTCKSEKLRPNARISVFRRLRPNPVRRFYFILPIGVVFSSPPSAKMRNRSTMSLATWQASSNFLDLKPIV